jgi:hypothetical protein
MIKIIYSDHNGTRAPLFHQYPLQHNPQRAYLDFNPESDQLTLTAGYNGEIGNAIPANVWNRKILRFSIEPATCESDLDSLGQNEELESLLKEIVAGRESDWQRGCYTEQAEYAIRSVESLLESELDTIAVWDSIEWIANCDSIVNDLADAGSIEKLADDCKPDHSSDFVVFGDLEEAVAKVAAGRLERKDPSDYTVKELRAAEILAAYDDDYKLLLTSSKEKTS